MEERSFSGIAGNLCLFRYGGTGAISRGAEEGPARRAGLRRGDFVQRPSQGSNPNFFIL
jgi:hypothetical protein